MVGSFGALMGIGGGLLMIPIFLFVLNYPAQQTIGTSLFIVFLNALSGTIAYLYQKKIFQHAAIRFGIATIPGAFLGGYAAQYFTGTGFSLAFGTFLILMSILIALKSVPKGTSEEFDEKTFQYNSSLGIVSSIGVGFLSSILGVGGGLIHVPLMIYLLNFPTHIATATSTCILAISSFSGVISHFMLGHVLWIPAICIGGGAILGAQIGAKMAKKTKARVIVHVLAVLIFSMGIKFVLTSL